MSSFSVYKRRVLHWKCIPIGIAHTASFPASQNLFSKTSGKYWSHGFRGNWICYLQLLLLPTVSIIKKYIYIIHFNIFLFITYSEKEKLKKHWRTASFPASQNLFKNKREVLMSRISRKLNMLSSTSSFTCCKYHQEIIYYLYQYIFIDYLQ